MPGIVQVLHWPSAKFNRLALEEFLRRELGAFEHQDLKFHSWHGTGVAAIPEPELPIM